MGADHHLSLSSCVEQPDCLRPRSSGLCEQEGRPWRERPKADLPSPTFSLVPFLASSRQHVPPPALAPVIHAHTRRQILQKEEVLSQVQTGSDRVGLNPTRLLSALSPYLRLQRLSNHHPHHPPLTHSLACNDLSPLLFPSLPLPPYLASLCRPAPSSPLFLRLLIALLLSQLLTFSSPSLRSCNIFCLDTLRPLPLVAF